MTDQVVEDCLEFISARHQVLLLSEGIAHDVVDAILEEQARDPAGASRAVIELEQMVGREDWPLILQSYSRCARIIRGEDVTTEVDLDLLMEPEEKKLFKSLVEAEKIKRRAGSIADFFEVFTPLVSTITNFFDEVLVMDEDSSIRANRLALLCRIVLLAEGVVDLSKLEGF